MDAQLQGLFCHQCSSASLATVETSAAQQLCPNCGSEFVETRSASTVRCLCLCLVLDSLAHWLSSRCAAGRAAGAPPRVGRYGGLACAVHGARRAARHLARGVSRVCAAAKQALMAATELG